MKKCIECKFYDWPHQYLHEIERWILAPCKVHHVDVHPNEDKCDDFQKSELKPYEGKQTSFKINGGKVGIDIAIKYKKIILEHPQMTGHDLALSIPITISLINEIRCGKRWPLVPCIYKVQSGGKYQRKKELDL